MLTLRISFARTGKVTGSVAAVRHDSPNRTLKTAGTDQTTTSRSPHMFSVSHIRMNQILHHDCYVIFWRSRSRVDSIF
jgi:hypothetical protein